ncbi:hypothetical protein LMJF_27_1340 [Leishmania major strain Friedlin]|uniref:Uncharacterized protein n=1 Tax=Leishmania major TaxID=5664 RepID=E9ADB5_LEIMA|nr:hypothetical protein LMJF_27_1340 [Leishmania major strain Friedlin]CAG9576742.1 hypothetical_protein_-_conserved [Leishmania major strain Friedlin]CBZ12202.1 hypothetical protein LMJF_27_1340 [Leishmania major strain Friedlin]|eukprot:XP_003721944.1 hypothetical protein LMJF_27_1340 [Leishmania major strain Friedlin]
MKTDDHLSQIHRMCRALGIRPGAPAPLIQPALTLQCPRLHTPMVVHEKPAAKIALPMLLSDSSGDVSYLAGQDSVGTLRMTPPGSPRTPALTSVSNMRHHAHLATSELPVSVLVASALSFVAAWRTEDSACTAQKDLIHCCLKARCDLELEEAGGRHRLNQLLLTVSEQMHRFVVMGEYSKFVVFCVDQEPVWRQAARQLQKENEARLHTTENIYSRFLMEEIAVSDKMRMFQEASDFVVSQGHAAREQRRRAQILAARRRCDRQSAPQETPMPFAPQSHLHPHQHKNESNAAALAGGWTPPQRQRPRDDSTDRRSGSSKERSSKNAKSHSTTEVDRYRQRWRKIIWFLSNGERGKPAPH